MYLIDTNVWLERLLEQTRSEDVKKLLDHTPSDRLFITDFAFHSIGIVLSRLKQIDAFSKFVQDVFIDGSVVLVHLEPEDTPRLISVMSRFNLDLDDAYQYTAAEKYNLIIVSFDSENVEGNCRENLYELPGSLYKLHKSTKQTRPQAYELQMAGDKILCRA